MIKHHPPFELLVDFASGSVSEPVALAVASHSEWCPECRTHIAELEAIGGVLLDGLEGVPLQSGALEGVVTRLDESVAEVGRPPAAASLVGAGNLPSALRKYIAAGLDGLPWKRIGRSFEEARLQLSAPGYKAALMRLKPGAVMPRHTHRGAEYTLVLSGGYSDAGRQFLRGDFSAQDPSNVHNPVVDADEECLCLIVLDAPVKLTGAVGRLVNPFLRI